jgi:hypothetical protein
MVDMTPELKTINGYLETLTDLESAINRSTTCLHSPESCLLQLECYRARPALEAALKHFRRMKKRLQNQGTLEERDEN